MTDTVTPLVHDLLDWLDRKPRTYAEAIDAWRTSCPRLPVWEDAFDRGLVSRTLVGGTPHLVLTEAGHAALPIRRSTGGSPRRVTVLEAYFESLRGLRVFEVAIRTGGLDRTCPGWPYAPARRRN